MNALVIYDTAFGNTEKIAQAIAASLGAGATVEIHRAGSVTPEHFGGRTLVVVGAPTQGFRPTKPVAGLLGRLRPGSLKGVKVAAFDTRFRADKLQSRFVRTLVKTGGYAAPRIAARLEKVGGRLAVPPEGFFVEDTEGPLEPGELERAATWAAQLLGAG